MYRREMRVCFIVFFLLNYVKAVPDSGNSTSSVSRGNKDEDKSSLVFVFDTTGSMFNDLRQLKESAEMILNTALEESNIIEDFVFVPFHDPGVGPPTVTRHKSLFKSALNIVRVYGGGDCPEKSLSGIIMALEVSRPRSFVYVFTDATAGDHRLVGKVLDLVQRKQSQVVFVLTGHCNDLQKPSYQVYEQIAAASSGQVFNLNKTNVHKVLEMVRTSIRGRNVNLGASVLPAGYNHTQGIPVDRTVGEVTVSVSGAKPQIKVVDPKGEEVTGPPKLITTLDLAEIMVVKVMQPEPGNWRITVGSERDYSVRVVGLSNLTFAHGFSVAPPASAKETSYRPLQSAYNHMLISVSGTDGAVSLDHAEILSLSGRTLYELPLKMLDGENRIYLADAFVPPDDFFYVAINGRVDNQEFRRVGATAVQAKLPDIPYLTVPRKISGRINSRVVLRCAVDSLVPVTGGWARGSTRLQPVISSLQSTSIEYVIENLREQDAGTYRCVARNAAGVATADTVVQVEVDPPVITAGPGNLTVLFGDALTVSCHVYSEVVPQVLQMYFKGTNHLDDDVMDVYITPNEDSIYKYNKTISHVAEDDSGVYTCVAVNKAGRATNSINITIQTLPTVQILGPHSVKKLKFSDIQLVCHVENAYKVQWLSPNNTVLMELAVNATYDGMFDVRNVTETGKWTCVGLRGPYKASDAISIDMLIKPTVVIEGDKNITIVNGTSLDISCLVTARPTPRIIWHRETENFLDHVITSIHDDVYLSVLTLNSSKEQVDATYFCIGENAQGIAEDSVVVNVRREMTLVKGFTDKSVELYSQVELHCLTDSYPPPLTKWSHNGTELATTPNVQVSDDRATVYVLMVDFDNLGSYACEADNGYEKMVINGTLTVFGLEPPKLLKEPTKVVAQKQMPTKLTCRVLKGKPEPTLTWQYKNVSSAELDELPFGISLNNEGSELSIPTVELSHNGFYRCIAENVLDTDAYDVELEVQYPPKVLGSGEELARQDGPIEKRAGEQVRFSCEATGVPAPLLVWSKDLRPVAYTSNVYLTDDNDLVIEKATVYDSGLYTCNAISPLGSSHKNFTLFVYVLPSIVPSQSLTEVEVVEGELVQLLCDGRGTPPPTVVWEREGRALPARARVDQNVVRIQTCYWFSLEVVERELVELPCVGRGMPPPAVGFRWEGHPLTARARVDQDIVRFVANLTDFGNYMCFVENEYGNASISYFLYVWVPPTVHPLEPSKTALIGTNVTLQCDAVGFPIPSILWKFQDELLMINNSNISFNDVGNLFINNVSSQYEGSYSCIAANVAGEDVRTIHLNVYEPPKIMEQNATSYLATNMDKEMVIVCNATGRPKPYIIWSKDGRYLDSDSNYAIDYDGTLTIKSPSEELSGLYTCLAKNSAGEANKTIPVDIYSVPIVQSEESLSKAVVVEGTNATVECPIRASSKDVLKWYKDAKLISSGVLTISNVSRHNSSSLACTVSNVAGAAAARVLLQVQWPPRLGIDGTRVDGVRGEDHYFDCTSDAYPKAKTKWLFNNKPMVFEDKDRLKLLNIQPQHAGKYQCITSNVHGTATKTFDLRVLVPPFISEFDFLEVQLKEGSDATLECNAKGSPTPDIKWTFNNSNWHLQDSTIVSSNVSTNSTGIFRCTASNAAGSASLTYQVFVVSAAKVQEIVLYSEGEATNVLKRADAKKGSHVRISCKASGEPVPKIQWIKNGNVLGENKYNTSSADLVLDDVKSADGGVYACVVFNEGGMDERKLRLEVLEPPKIFHALLDSDKSGNTVDLEVLSGQHFAMHCHPIGNPIPEVYWFKDGLPLRFFDDTMVSSDYGEVIVSNKALYEQSGNYTCVARNNIGNTSLVYLVDVLVPPPILKDNVKIATTRVGHVLNLTCPAEGSPAPLITWLRQPYVELSDDIPRVTLLNDNITLLINNTEVSDSGKYSCEMTNKVGTTEVSYDVTIEMAPLIVGNEGSETEYHVLPLTRSVVLKCEVKGNPPPTITWLKDTQLIPSDSANIQPLPGSSLLSIWRAAVAAGGQYACAAHNAAGDALRRYRLAVRVPGKWSSWSTWNYCNATCGLGYQRRTRICQYIDVDNTTYDINTKSDKVILDTSECKGSDVDKRRCHMPPCEEPSTAQWGAWGIWGRCTATCGSGTQARTRRCKSVSPCYGDNVQIRKCPNLSRCEGSSGKSAKEPSSMEDTTEMDQYMPEEVYEMQPEVINARQLKSLDVEEFDTFDTKPAAIPTPAFFDVPVTSNLDFSEPGACDPGFRHNRTHNTCDDIDECSIEYNQCHSTQVCVNTRGGYQCGCPQGYTSLGAGQRCLDVNECAQELDGCAWACVNVAGGYVCACPRHLRLHADRRHCVAPSEYRQSIYDDMDTGEYLSAFIEFPAKKQKGRS